MLDRLWHSLWFIQVALHLAVWMVLVKRKAYQQFPIFVCYVGWIALEGLILLAVYYAPFTTGNQYALTFGAGAAVATGLRFAIIYEIFDHLLRGYPMLRSSAVAWFRWVTVALLAAVIALAWLAPARGTGHVMSVFFLLQRTVDVLLCGLLVFLVGFSGFFHLTWRSQIIGIALGLAVVATVGLATSAIRAEIQPIVHNQTTDMMEIISQSTYVCSALIWIAYLLVQERTRPNRPGRLPQHDLETWNDELQRLLRP